MKQPFRLNPPPVYDEHYAATQEPERTECPPNNPHPTRKGEDMTQHTPGPWRVVEDERTYNNGYMDLIDVQGYDIMAGAYCVVGCEGIGTSDEDAANARLIAAAPDLLAALEDIVRAEWTAVSLQAMTPQHRRRLEKARAAIAAATGTPT